MRKIVTFGEIMMRLNPEGYLRIVQADSYEATYAGAEASVAVSLSNYGMKASFVSKLPAHEVGQSAINALRKSTSARAYGNMIFTPETMMVA